MVVARSAREPIATVATTKFRTRGRGAQAPGSGSQTDCYVFCETVLKSCCSGFLREVCDKCSWQANKIGEHDSWSMPSQGRKARHHVHHHQGEVDSQHDSHS